MSMKLVMCLNHIIPTLRKNNLNYRYGNIYIKKKINNNKYVYLFISMYSVILLIVLFCFKFSHYKYPTLASK